MHIEILFPALLVLIVGTIIFSVYYFSKKAVVKRKLKKAVGMKIAEFMNGDVAKVVGTVEFVGEPLIAPLSGRRCAYYYVLVEELRSDGKSSHWQKIIEEEVKGSFIIRDGRYRAYIRSSSSNIKSYLVQDANFASGFKNDATEVLEKYLNAHGRKSESWLHTNKRIRYKEGILEEGETIAVVGRGEWMSATELQLPDGFGKVLVLSSTPDAPIYLSDDPETVTASYLNQSY